MSKSGHDMKKKIFQNVSLIILNTFYRKSSQKITENGRMTAVWRHTSKSGHDMNKKFCSKCFSDDTEQLLT